MIPTLILAAGKSSRMGGGDKLLEQIDGVALLRRQCDRALASGPVLVTLPARDHPRAAVVPDAAQIVPVDGAMSDSLRAGLAALPAQVQGVVILPADLPDITAEDIAALKTAAATTDHAILRATTADHKPGHPIYFARRTFGDFAQLTGDRGAQPVCDAWGQSTGFLPLADDRARLDLDTPEDWAAYRAQR